MVAQVRTHPALTQKQEFFARLIAQGKGSSEAYRIAYDAAKMKAGAIRSNAYKLVTLPHVASKIRELQEQADATAVLTRTRKRHLLWEIAEAKRNKPMERIAAMSEDSKMVGDYTPVKIEGDVTLGLVLGSLMQSTLVPEKLAQPVNEPITVQADSVQPEPEAQQPAIPSPLPQSVTPTGPLDTPAPQPPLKRLATSREYDDE